MLTGVGVVIEMGDIVGEVSVSSKAEVLLQKYYSKVVVNPCCYENL